MADFRILIVDDHSEVRRLAQAWVETLGKRYEVVAVPSGEEAMLVSARKPIDLLVADYRLPGMNGIELMAKIKARTPSLKVILITGITDMRVRKQVASAGANAFFIKPIEMADFLDAIERCLGVVQTLLPQAPIAPLTPEPGQARPTIENTLANLRNDLKANAVILVDGQGQVLKRAGEISGSQLESSLIPAALSTLTAGQKVSASLGAKNLQQISFYDVPGSIGAGSTNGYTLCLANIWTSHALMIGLPARDDLAGQVIACLHHAIPDLLAALAQPTISEAVAKTGPLPAEKAPAVPLVPIVPVAPVKVTTAEEIFSEARLAALPVEEPINEPLPDLSDLFGAEKKIEVTSIDSFWDTLAEEGSRSGLGNTAALSYEEAERLGLAPKKREEGKS